MKKLKSMLFKAKSFNPVLVGFGTLIIFSVFYFLYSREQTRQNLYATLLVGPYPYWQESSVNVGDKDQSSFGQINAEVLEKESFDAGGNGRSSILLAKIALIKDRAGILLYKNKPIAIGSSIALRLPLVDLVGMILRLENKSPALKEKKLRVKFLNKGYEPEKLASLKNGTEMKSDKGKVYAKIIDFIITPHEVRSDTASGQAVVTYDHLKRDLQLTAEILINEFNDEAYFLHTRKVKEGETIDLLFKDFNLWKLNIISVEELE